MPFSDQDRDDDDTFPARRAPSYLVTPAHAHDAFKRIRHYRVIADIALARALQSEPGSDDAMLCYARHDYYTTMAEQWSDILQEWLSREAGEAPPLPGHLRC